MIAIQGRTTLPMHTALLTQSCDGFPTKLVEWVGSNLSVELGYLGIPPKQGSLWTASELNTIITGIIVGGPHGHLHTFGCIQWECELLNGRPKAQ